MRSWGSSWEVPLHPPRTARAPRLPRPLTPRAGLLGHRPWSSLRAPDARRGPGGAAGSPRRGGRGGARRGAGKAAGPGRSRAAHPRSGAMAAPWLLSARPLHPASHPSNPRRWPGETPALKVGAAGASEQWRRQQLKELRTSPPVGPGTFSASSPPPLGHSSRSPCALHLSSHGPAALPRHLSRESLASAVRRGHSFILTTCPTGGEGTARGGGGGSVLQETRRQEITRVSAHS